MPGACVSGEARAAALEPRLSWVGWCCSYCSAPLEVHAHGLFCRAEGRWFATLDGVHRLLPEDRRRELAPAVEMYQRVRRDDGWRAHPGLPEVPRGDRHAAVWRQRSARFEQAVSLVRARLGPGPWRVLDVGAGCCWASARLLRAGHRTAAVDVSLDAEDGLRAAPLLVPSGCVLERAEADMEAIPIEPAAFDLVLAAASLHHAPRPGRTLIELRRVTRRDGLLLVLDSPVYRRRPDGEAMVAARMRAQARRYGVAMDRERQSGYLVRDELPDLFRSTGWSLEVHGWPGPFREWARDMVEIPRRGRRTARFPILLARRDG